MIKEVKQKRKRENKQKRYQMGFERGEAPSRVEGRALVGQGKAQKPSCDFQPKGLKELKPLLRSRKMGFERDEVPSRVEGGALVGQDKAQKSACFRNVKKKEFLHKGFISPSP